MPIEQPPCRLAIPRLEQGFELPRKPLAELHSHSCPLRHVLEDVSVARYREHAEWKPEDDGLEPDGRREHDCCLTSGENSKQRCIGDDMDRNRHARLFRVEPERSRVFSGMELHED